MSGATLKATDLTTLPVAGEPAAARQFSVLYEAEGLPAYDLPEKLRATYGGTLGFSEPRLVANFVATIDGVTALPEVPHSTRLISAGSPADRFVLGLLRACADLVLLGAGTLHAHPDTLWTGSHAHAASADAFAELRRRRGQPSTPLLTVVTASGDLNIEHPALRTNAIVLTSERGGEKLAGRLPADVEVLVVGQDSTLDLSAALAVLHARGHRLIVSEAGPHLFGSLLAADLVDELFLTQSPLIAGRGADPRYGLAEGTALLPALHRHTKLLSIRRAEHHLFLRYGLRSA